MEVPSADAGPKVVSFDLFDTLLIRPFVRPTDLFRLMERINDVPGFADRRIQILVRITPKEKNLD